MRYLYLDNFKGFQNALIPLRDVNFLVGENSTGKTSVMAVLCMLMDGYGYEGFKYNTSNFHLGAFNEIVSNFSNDNKQFQIASIQKGEMEDDFRMNAFKFSDYKGLAGLRNGMRVIKNKLKYFTFKKTCIYQSVKEHIDSGFENKLKLLIMDMKEGNYIRGIRFERSGSQILIRPSFPLPQSFSFKAHVDVSKLLYNPCVFNRQTCWMAPIRSAPQAIYKDYATEYDSTGGHIPYKLHEVYLSKRKKQQKIVKALHEFGKNSGLFDEIKFEDYKSSDPSAPFRIFVKLGEHYVNIKHVGYGVSQILPVIGDLLMKPPKTAFYIQQPEIHMHPKAQAAFGKFLHDYCKIEKDSFVFLETHSDFIIDRYRLEQQETEEKVDSQVLYFERSDNGNQVFPLPINSSGKFESKIPKGYRKFFVNESMEMLDL